MFDLYKKVVTGDVTTYIRPYQTMSYGPLGANNTMVISEEKVIILPDASVEHFPLQQLNVEITDPNASFDIVHPVTGVVTGTMTFAQLKIQMYSLYLYLAALRDAEEAEIE